MTNFIIGLSLGVAVGVVLMAVMSVAKDDRNGEDGNEQR